MNKLKFYLHMHVNLCHALFFSFAGEKNFEKQAKKIEQKMGLPAGHIAEILYQTIKKGQYNFNELLKALEKINDDEVTTITKKFAKKIAEAKEAFILEEMKPYYDYIDMATSKIVWSQKVRLRLAEYTDWKRQFEQEKENIQQKLIEDIEKFCKENYWAYDTSILALIPIVNKCFGVKK